VDWLIVVWPMVWAWALAIPSARQIAKQIRVIFPSIGPGDSNPDLF
jgi:hypothetical protein